MITRCLVPDNPDYKNYGGRGITVCPEWQGPDGFERYIEYVEALPNYRRRGYTDLDRIDNDGDYGPGNIRWATKKMNVNNRTRRYPN